MELDSARRFEATQITDFEWVVHDRAYDENDARRVVAHIWQADPDEYEVTRVRALPLDRWYDSVHSVIEDVIALTVHSATPIDLRPGPAAPADLAATV